MITSIENSIVKLEFEIINDYLDNIKIYAKDKDIINKIYTGDPVILNEWLNQFSSMIIRFISNSPLEKIFIEPQKQEKNIDNDSLNKPSSDFFKCPKCQKQMIRKKQCCGSSDFVWQCEECNIKYKIGPHMKR